MKRDPPQPASKSQSTGSLDFPPRFEDQAKYLKLADDFLATDPPAENVIGIDTSKEFRKPRKKKAA